MEEGSAPQNLYPQIAIDSQNNNNSKNEQSKVTKEPDIETPMIDPEQNDGKYRCFKFKRNLVSSLFYFLLIACLAGSIMLIVFGFGTRKYKTGIENQCSGYSTTDDNNKPNGKVYVNCYYENIQCKFLNCSQDQCLKSEFGILSCVPPDFDTYYGDKGNAMIVMGIILTVIFSFLTLSVLIVCKNEDRYVHFQEICPCCCPKCVS